eukprot:CAMPEP_0202727688 /NCGR_PEP_ID=MMETSP1385-20130828/185251_1 /ASSEMBLY_ACC=CAM_ASM_000861 /TAXON_ID=933848 /ORGANISM="Elphidium margaritaceum" /LENGTH=314 /DNA_ID=CAMNT_0049393931 /DNA_START=24 /DNA_END=964 /DNA_ORIENTATION=-
MGNEALSQLLAQAANNYACCGSKSATVKQELDTESNQSMNVHASASQSDIAREESPTNASLNNDAFDFDAWISQNGLIPIKKIFERYSMTDYASLNNENEKYRHFISDQELRMNYSHLMQAALDAIAALHQVQPMGVQMGENNTNQTKAADTDEKHADDKDESESESGDDYDRDDVETIKLIKADCIALCNNDFRVFVTHALKQTAMVDGVWHDLDPHGTGSIETQEQLSSAIFAFAAMYNQQKYRQMMQQQQSHGNGHTKRPSRKRIETQAAAIALWVCKSYGSIGQAMKYKYRVSKTEFITNLPLWIQEYTV